MFKAIIFAVALIVIASPALAANPTSTWQTYGIGANQLVVYDTEFLTRDSNVIFSGRPADYKGEATYPVTAPHQYKQRIKDLRNADEFERIGKTERAEDLRAKWL